MTWVSAPGGRLPSSRGNGRCFSSLPSRRERRGPGTQLRRVSPSVSQPLECISPLRLFLLLCWGKEGGSLEGLEGIGAAKANGRRRKIGGMTVWGVRRVRCGGKGAGELHPGGWDQTNGAVAAAHEGSDPAPLQHEEQLVWGISPQLQCRVRPWLQLQPLQSPQGARSRSGPCWHRFARRGRGLSELPRPRSWPGADWEEGRLREQPSPW